MEQVDCAHISGHLEQEFLTIMELLVLHIVLVTLVIVMQHHFHLLKLETTISVTEQMDLIHFGLEKAE